jgi:hypothetical protein
MDPFSTPNLSKADEQRLRELAHAVTRGIEDAPTILLRLDFTMDDYMELAETRMFRQMLREAQSEWEGAGNTHKRIKQKAAMNIEQALPHFFQAMISDKEPLSSKVKAFEVVSRVAGLGAPEPLGAGAGQFFKLEINLGAGVQPLVLGGALGQAEEMTLEHDALEAGDGIPALSEGRPAQSRLFDALPLEEL